MTVGADDLAIEQRRQLDFAAGGHPSWFVGVEVTREMLIGFAVLFDRARRQIDHYFDMTYVRRATVGGADDPDWLDGLAHEIDDYRQVGEDDPTLQERLRTVPAAITRPQILAAVEAFLAARGLNTDVALEQLPLEAGYCMETPSVMSDAIGHAFAFEPAPTAWSSWTSSTKPFGFVLIVDASVPADAVTSLRVLLDEISAAGYAARVERSG